MTSGDGSGPILAVRNLEVVYGAAIQVLRGVSLEVQPGKIVTLLGANGAGKTSLLRAVSGLLRFHRGSIPRGTVEILALSQLGMYFSTASGGSRTRRRWSRRRRH